MAKLYDVKRDNEANAPLDDFTVPVGGAFTGTNSVEVTFTNASPGEYVIAYNFVLSYAGQKDKAIFWKTTGTYGLGSVYSESVAAASSDAYKNRLYGSRVVHSTVGDIVHGIEFSTLGEDFGAKVVTCDVSITKISNL